MQIDITYTLDPAITLKYANIDNLLSITSIYDGFRVEGIIKSKNMAAGCVKHGFSIHEIYCDWSN